MKKVLTQAEWIALDQVTKSKLRELFKIKRSGPTEVVNNVLISDGTLPEDLETLDMASMIEYLGAELPFYDSELFNDLFAKTINKLYGKTKPPKQIKQQVRNESDAELEPARPRKSRGSTTNLPELT